MQILMENYKIYPELSNYHCMHRLLAKPSVLTSSSALRSLPRSTRTKRGTRSGTQTWCLINLGPKRMFQARGQKSPNALRTCGICSLQIWARQKLCKRWGFMHNYGALCIRLLYTAFQIFWEHYWLEGNFKQPSEPLSCRLRREARKEENYYVPGDPKLAFCHAHRWYQPGKI